MPELIRSTWGAGVEERNQVFRKESMKVFQNEFASAEEKMLNFFLSANFSTIVRFHQPTLETSDACNM